MKINLIEYLEHTAKLYPAKTALVDAQGSITFSELITGSKKIASKIIKSGAGVNQPVAILIPKSIDALVAAVGILYSGNFYVPIDVNSPEKRVEAILNNLSPVAVITQTKIKSGPLLNNKAGALNIITEEDISNHHSDSKAITDRLSKLIDTDPAYTIYTSGSTGTPKGVVISHRSIIDYIEWAIDCFKIDEKEIIGNQSPFYFDNSTLDIFLCLFTGATLVIIPESLYIFPIKLLEYVNEKQINLIFWVPSVLINIANIKLLDNYKLPHLKKILFAGEVMPTRHLNYWIQKLPNAEYANLYGPTEITVDCTYYKVTREFNNTESLPIGFPCRNSDILILTDDNQIAAIGKPGELCVRGSSLALGYWNDFEKTNNAFTQNPLNKNYPERIYRTGDLVHKNELGEIIYLGRKDSQVKHQGYRIELGEIEHVVINNFENIDNACALYNFNKKEICLFYESAAELTVADFRKKLLEHLPKYMIPSQFFPYKELPKNANGKIDRNKLKTLISE